MGIEKESKNKSEKDGEDGWRKIAIKEKGLRRKIEEDGSWRVQRDGGIRRKGPEWYNRDKQVIDAP